MARKRSTSPVVSCTWTAAAYGLGRSLVAGQAGVGGGPARRARHLEPVHRQQLGQGRCRGRRGIDDRDPVADGVGEGGADERVVGAAEQEGVDPGRGRSREHELPRPVALAQQRRQVLGDDRLELGAAEDPGLDHRHEARGRVLVDLDRRVLVLDRVEVGVRADGGRRRDDAHAPVARGERRRGGAGPDDAQHRQVVAGPQVAERDGRGRVAGDDQRLDVARRELVEGLGGEPADLVVRPDAVGGAGVVAEVDRGFVRRPAEDLAEDGQATDARVEDTDRPRVGHDRGATAAWRRRAPAPPARRRSSPGPG